MGTSCLALNLCLINCASVCTTSCRILPDASLCRHIVFTQTFFLGPQEYDRDWVLVVIAIVSMNSAAAYFRQSLSAGSILHADAAANSQEFFAGRGLP